MEGAGKKRGPGDEKADEGLEHPMSMMLERRWVRLSRFFSSGPTIAALRPDDPRLPHPRDEFNPEVGRRVSPRLRGEHPDVSANSPAKAAGPPVLQHRKGTQIYRTFRNNHRISCQITNVQQLGRHPSLARRPWAEFSPNSPVSMGHPHQVVLRKVHPHSTRQTNPFSPATAASGGCYSRVVKRFPGSWVSFSRFLSLFLRHQRRNPCMDGWHESRTFETLTRAGILEDFFQNVIASCTRCAMENSGVEQIVPGTAC